MQIDRDGAYGIGQNAKGGASCTGAYKKRGVVKASRAES